MHQLRFVASVRMSVRSFVRLKWSLITCLTVKTNAVGRSKSPATRRGIEIMTNCWRGRAWVLNIYGVLCNDHTTWTLNLALTQTLTVTYYFCITLSHWWLSSCHNCSRTKRQCKNPSTPLFPTFLLLLLPSPSPSSHVFLSAFLSFPSQLLLQIQLLDLGKFVKSQPVQKRIGYCLPMPQHCYGPELEAASVLLAVGSTENEENDVAA